MGFSIWVADDPELAALERAQEAGDVTVAGAFDYPHFSISLEGMDALRHEMQAQGMFEAMPATSFQLNDGDHVTGDELRRALALAREQPATGRDAELSALWGSWLAFLRSAVDHDGIRVY